MRKKIGVIIQRFGEEIIGGSEFYALNLLGKLSDKYDITVYTSTAKDYLTWENGYPEGESKIGNINVKRFPVKRQRDIDEFNNYSNNFFKNNKHTLAEEKEWIIRQGPFVPDLIEAVKNEQGNYDFFFLFTYLYYPVVFSIPIIKKPKFLIPTTHDELPLYMKIMEDTFHTPEVILSLTEQELALINKKFHRKNNQLRTLIGGIGIEPPEKIIEKEFIKKIKPIIPYIIYIGRIDEGKGVNFLIDNFMKYSASNYCQLLLGGKKNMEIPSDFRIKYLGYLSDEEKWQSLKGATLYVHPSMYESLSISMLEAMAVGTPVLVNGNSLVMKDHIDKSKAGLYYYNREEFVESLDFLLKNKEIRQKMGENGKHYVKNSYSWKSLMDKLEKILSNF